MKQSTRLPKRKERDDGDKSRASIMPRALWLPPSPEECQAEHALGRPTLLAAVSPASQAAEAMGERAVPGPCAAVHAQPHAPLHGQLPPELLRPRAARFALCLWAHTACRVWLEQRLELMGEERQ